MPRVVVVPGQEALAVDINTISDATVHRFDSAAQREGQWPAPFDGALSYLIDERALDQWQIDGNLLSSWHRVWQFEWDTFLSSWRFFVPELTVSYPAPPDGIGMVDGAHGHSTLVGGTDLDPGANTRAAASDTGFTVTRFRNGSRIDDILNVVPYQQLVTLADLGIVVTRWNDSNSDYRDQTVKGGTTHSLLTESGATAGQMDLWLSGDVHAGNVPAALLERLEALEVAAFGTARARAPRAPIPAAPDE